MRYIIGIIVLGLTVLFHEFGHFLLARLNHITVLEFAIGMGPKILSFTSKKSGTVFAWRALPFGGSCSMLNEDEGEELPGSFVGAALWRRALVVAAGPVFNFILALLASFIIIGFAGADPARVAEVDTGSPEAAAGLMEGDMIVKFNGHSIANARELYMDMLINEIPTDQVSMTVKRDGRKQVLTFTPQTNTRYMLGFYYDNTDDNSGVVITMLEKDSVLKAAGLLSGDVITKINGTSVTDIESMQAYLAEHPMDGSPLSLTYTRNGHEKELTGLIPHEKTNAVLSFSYSLMREKQGISGLIAYSFGEVGYWIRMTLKTLGGMFNGTFGLQDMSGPVGIVKSVGDSYGEAVEKVSVGSAILTLLSVMSMISANLGIVNLIPLPALDGGRLFMMLIEAIRRKPANRDLEARINFTGLILLLCFIAYVTVHDIMKLF